MYDVKNKIKNFEQVVLEIFAAQNKFLCYDVLGTVAYLLQDCILKGFSMRKLTWFFDFISPFAYLQFEQLGVIREKLPQNVEIEYCPLLFAGLLKHWEHKGPAEIPAKRLFTYRYVYWLAKRENIPLNMPAAHPFNPLLLLRLAIAKCNEETIRKIFYFVWREGKSVDCQDDVNSLLDVLDSSHEEISSKDIKEKLIFNGRRALELGVFGVPTFVFDRQIFWGYDSSEMLIDYIKSPQIFEEHKDISNLPVGNIKRKLDG